MKVGLLVAVLVLAACGGGSQALETAPEPGSPALSGTTLDGERLSLDGLGRAPVFVVAFSFF